VASRNETVVTAMVGPKCEALSKASKLFLANSFL
jgi:hypothetical protein